MIKDYDDYKVVFPMYVGVILTPSLASCLKPSIPHVCGGDPRTDQRLHMVHDVFPMYVGVILQINNAFTNTISIPHVCGGDPLP